MTLLEEVKAEHAKIRQALFEGLAKLLKENYGR